DRQRVHEVLLEARLDGSLDLLDATYELLDLGARRAVQERDARASPRCAPGGRDLLRVAVREEAEHERMDRVDVRSERSRKADAVDALDPVMVHEQRAARMER